MDAEQFRQVVLPYHRKLYCVAFRLLENADDAEDVVQEAYLKLWDKRELLMGVENVEAFCMTLVKNMCFDLLRSTKYMLNRQSVDLEEVHSWVQHEKEEVADAFRCVKQIIAHLPQQQRRIVVLRDLKGCSYQEIEEIMGVSSVSIRVMLSRARKKIREEYIKWNEYECR